MAGKSRNVKVVFQDKAQREAELTAYAFDRRGKLTGSVALSGDSIDLQKLGDAPKVLLGPTVPKESGREVTMDWLRKAQAMDISKLETAIISPDIGKIWLLCYCQITGRVVRSVSGVDFPVCHARVHICEVDRWPLIFYKAPDLMIRKIRAELLDLPELIDFKPIPEPIPGPDPAPDRHIHAHADAGHAMAAAPRVAAVEMTARSATTESTFRAAADAIPASVKAGLSSDSLDVVRSTLANNFIYIYPLICYWPWFWYSCDEIGVVETDEDGRFTLPYWYPCFGDQPDIYVWVEFLIGGIWTTIYRPPKACNTRWNYACGSDIIVRITDERVPYCTPPSTLTGKKLILTTVGNNVNVSTIQRASSGANQGLTAGGEPFGGSIEPHVDFGLGLQSVTAAPNSAALFYFRWSYRRAGTTGTFTVIDQPVYRRYRVEPPAADPYYRDFPLGPVVGMPTTMYRIPPQDPIDPTGAPAQWVTLNARDETASAFFLSRLLESSNPALGEGKYEMLLELFDNTGALITNWGAAGIDGYVVDPSVSAPFGPGTLTTVKVTGVPAMAEYDYKPTGPLGPSAGMMFVVHIDNNHCEASIDALTGTGLTSDVNCGFYIYSPFSQVDVGFIAKHRNNFAYLDFDIHRGASIPVGAVSLPAGGGTIRVGTTANGFSFNAATWRYVKTGVPVAALLGGCPKAAFAETLGVAAMATDGWSRLSDLDASGIPRAFALSDV